MQSILSLDPSLSVETAADPIFALRKISAGAPDVLITDLEMPRMDGVDFIRTVMRDSPLPVIVCSGLAERGTSLALRVLDLGVAEIITKPKLGIKEFLNDSGVMLLDAVHSAVLSRKRSGAPVVPPSPSVLPPRRLALHQTVPAAEPLIVLGASTGGVEALTCILQAMPVDSPPILVVQHMPEHFTRAFAERLNSQCALEVYEAVEGQRLRSGLALIAPGNLHLTVSHTKSGYQAHLHSGPLISRHRPSVDELFCSAARVAGANAIAAILTGMGDDGARGLLEMRQADAQTIAQDQASCVVFGMPAEAIRCNAAQQVLPLSKIAPAICTLLRKRFGIA
jgi:two-component system chemotaxis response regulator CheB